MKVDSIVKFGSLAFDVAQDEKIRELLTMVHRGAKRRGLIGPPPSTPNQQKATIEVKPAETNKTKAPAIGTPVSKIPFGPLHPAWTQQTGSLNLEKYLTLDNAKKAVDWVGIMKNFLVK